MYFHLRYLVSTERPHKIKKRPKWVNIPKFRILMQFGVTKALHMPQMGIKLHISMKYNSSRAIVSILRYLVSPECPHTVKKRPKWVKIPKFLILMQFGVAKALHMPQMGIKVDISMKYNCSSACVSILRYLVSPEGPHKVKKRPKWAKIPKFLILMQFGVTKALHMPQMGIKVDISMKLFKGICFHFKVFNLSRGSPQGQKEAKMGQNPQISNFDAIWCH